MVIDFRKKNPDTSIKGQTVQCVQSYKYLGMIIDSKLTFETNCEAVCKKWHQHLFCLRKLSRFHIDKSIMTLFYHAVIESLLLFTLAAWLGLALFEKQKLTLPDSKVVQQADW